MTPLFERGEFGFIAALSARAGSDPRLRLGIGDDCGARELAPGHLLLTTSDLLLEEIHFRRDWTDPRSLGRKAVTVNVSDIAAMGGTPDHLFLGLGLPDDLAEEDVAALMEGVYDGLAAYGLTLAGGDTCRSRFGLMIAVTLQGQVPADELVRRGGARPGDRLWVSGTLGGSAGALQSLLSGRIPGESLHARHLRPEARVSLGRLLAGRRIAAAMIDLSDGLLADLGHLAAACGSGAEVASWRLPLAPGLAESFSAAEALDLALTGGEDYELLFAVPEEKDGLVLDAARECGVAVTPVGRLTECPGRVEVVDEEGRSLPVITRGFDHFAGHRRCEPRRFAAGSEG